jgi:hypothetical protein
MKTTVMRPGRFTTKPSRADLRIRAEEAVNGRELRSLACNVSAVERKYDREYWQVYIDVSKPGARIKIFSKSGRDSTSELIPFQVSIAPLDLAQRNSSYE